MQNIPKNSKIPHPQISLKQFSNICENVFFIFYFATTTHCNFKFWKIDPPYYTVRQVV